MEMLRLYSGSDGQSHFEDIKIELDLVYVAKCSAIFATDSIQFGSVEGLDELPWHTQESPVYIVILRGSMELEVGDGSKRILSAGDILLSEDTTGQGHITRSVNGGSWEFLIAPVKKE